MSAGSAGQTNEWMDFSAAVRRDCWLHHPVVGDPSWDSFVREKGNPILVGQCPHEWPVNGFLFYDEPSGRWYCFAGCYARGYWQRPAVCRLLRQDGDGWTDLGIVLQGDPATFDGNDQQQAGHMPDVAVVYDAGRYHMVYDWASLEGRRSGIHGGLAYAWADRPEGPWQRADRPIIDEVGSAVILGRYVRTYGGTLLRRKNDWLILTAMSTSRNSGGTWAMAGMTAVRPEGPYTPPQLLLYPQSDCFLPIHVEYFPAFAHEGVVYVPATSVASNRSFQMVFHSPLEEAHKPEAWHPWQIGSVWHDEPVRHEAKGIWGQTFSGQVGPDGMLRAMFPSRTSSDFGTISMAARPWAGPYRDGFVLSAPNAPAFAILRRWFDDFVLRLAASVLPAGGTGATAWSICWDCHSPIGPGKMHADAQAHPLMRSGRTMLTVAGSTWTLGVADETGQISMVAEGVVSSPKAGLDGVASGGYGPAPTEVQIHRRGSQVDVDIAGQRVWTGQIPSRPGRIELVAEAGTVLHVGRFALSNAGDSAREFYLASDALAGAAEGSNWQEVRNECFRFGVGFETAAGRAKWNYVGEGFRLHAPRGPRYGSCRVVVDGHVVAEEMSLAAAQAESSDVILEQALAYGPHCVAMVPVCGVIPCDCLEVNSGPPAG